MRNKIIVIGDDAVDRTVYVKTTKLCPEAPVPVVVPIKVEENHGMAGNVFSNLKSMARKNSIEFIFIRPKEFNLKIRYVDKSTGYIMLRVDEDYDRNNVGVFHIALLNDIDLKTVSSIVISDYGKGFLNKENIKDISEIAYKHGIDTFLDTKFILGSWSRKIFCVKINELEYEINNKNLTVEPFHYCRNLVVTKAERGSVLMSKNIKLPIPTNKVNVADVCGAGDTMLAGLVLHYHCNNDLPRAVEFANKVASFAVTKHGVYTVTSEDLSTLNIKDI